MRNPNYHYELNTPDLGEADGWKVWFTDGSTKAAFVVWGKTKAAARSRLLRQLKRFQAEQAKQEEVNDQS